MGFRRIPKSQRREHQLRHDRTPTNEVRQVWRVESNRGTNHRHHATRDGDENKESLCVHLYPPKEVRNTLAKRVALTEP